MHQFLLHRKRSATAPVISVKYGRIFALNSALQESRLATLSTQIFIRQSTSLFVAGRGGCGADLGLGYCSEKTAQARLGFDWYAFSASGLVDRPH